jgi:hypothetical protein
MSTKPAKVNWSISRSSQLPDQLVIIDGRLRLKPGEEPTFENIPNGTVCSLVPRDDLAEVLDQNALVREFVKRKLK